MGPVAGIPPMRVIAYATYADDNADGTRGRYAGDSAKILPYGSARGWGRGRDRRFRPNFSEEESPHYPAIIRHSPPKLFNHIPPTRTRILILVNYSK